MNIKKILVGAAAGALMLGALAVPAFAAVGPLQNQITFYTENNGANFLRSSTPFSGTESQSANLDASVTMSITGATGYADSGFVIYDGTLGGLDNFSLTGTGNYGVNLWFDNNADNEFFTWSGNTYTGVGSDSYILGPSSSGGNLTITDSSQFTSLNPGGGSYTLAQLKAGDAAGITSATHIAIWAGVTVGSGGSQTATVSLVAPATCPNGTVQSSSPLETVTVNSASSTVTPSSNVLSLGKNYLLVSSGVWTNTGKNVADAEYASVNNWATVMDGYDISPYFLGVNEFDLQVDGAFLNWGAYNSAHTYNDLYTGTGNPVKFLVFDGDSTVANPSPNLSWYGDNTGNLSVAIYSCNLNKPTNKDQCKNGGWQSYGVFKNQGDCVSFVATGGKNLPAGQ